VAAGGVLALVGVLTFITGLVMLAGDQWLRDRYWLAALLVTVLAPSSRPSSPSAASPRSRPATWRPARRWPRSRRIRNG
jgi:hypothetical protein